MRHFAILLLPLLFLACKKEPEPNEAAVHVQLGYSAAPNQGCIVVEAWGGPGEPLTETFLLSSVAKETGKFNVAVYRKADWSRDVRIKVSVRELSCDDSSHVADSREKSFNFRSAGRKEWLLHDLQTMDADGDGYIARSTLPDRGGTDCDDGNDKVNPAATELCNGIDDNCTGGVDEGLPTQEWFLDGDRDGYGSGTPVVSCGPPSDRYVDRGGDCNDSNEKMHPNAVELCNGEDDNCDGIEDEPFLAGNHPQPKDGACEVRCAGKYACNADGTGTTCIAPEPRQYYEDVDGDGEGNRDFTPVDVCPGAPTPEKMVTDASDCDDRDSRTNTQAAEVCDGLDNNCNGDTDEDLTCGSLKLVTDPVLEGGQWRTVAVGPSGYPVWLAGLGGRLAVKKSAVEKFVSHSGDTPSRCGDSNTDWHAAWVNPNDGHVFLAGHDGWLAQHDGNTCRNQLNVNFEGKKDYFTSIVGFEATPVIFAVSSHGFLYEWKSSGLHHTSLGAYWGLHGLSADWMYAVGKTSQSGPELPLVNLHTPPNRDAPTPQSLQVEGGYVGSLRAVWMAKADLTYAVGDAGLVVKGSGQQPTWKQVPAPVGTTPNFSSVVTPPGSDVAYIVDQGSPGRLYRLTQHGWAKTPAFSPSNQTAALRDIAMTSEADFWIVGDNGHVYHFPEP